MKTIATMLFSFCTAAFLPLPGMAADDAKPAGIEEIAETTAVVESVDVPNRVVTIKDESGAVRTLEVPARVKNLPQLKPGDKIRARYKVAIATMIKKPGEASGITEKTESATVAPPGAKPGGTAQRQITTTIKVKAVDPVKNTLTFEGPRGRTRTVEVMDPQLQAVLKNLKPGDDVEVVYSEALAIDVLPAKS